MNLLLNILLDVVPIIMAASTIAVFMCIPVGIIFFVLAHGEMDVERKRKWKRRAIWTILTPFLIIFLSVFFWGFVNVVNTTLTN